MARPHRTKDEKNDDEEDMIDRARTLVETFRIVIAPGKRDGFVGYTLEMPGVVSYGIDRHRCLEAVLREQTNALVTIMENAIEVPTVPDNRDVLLSMRVSETERDRLRAAATRSGHESLSEFLRVSALSVFNGSQRTGLAKSEAAMGRNKTKRERAE